MEDLERIAALEQALRDATGQRDAAQRRAARQGEQAKTWQQRAEERDHQIEELTAQLAQARSIGGWFAARIGRAPAASARRAQPAGFAAPIETSRRRVTFPTVKVAALVDDPLLKTILAETHVLSIENDLTALDNADLVVVEAPAMAAADAPLRARFDAWVSGLARAPLVMVDGDRTLALRSTDVVATRSWARNGGRSDAWAIPATFDTMLFNPRRDFEPGRFVKATGMSVPDSEEGIFATPFDPRQPWMLAAAATGFPFPHPEGRSDDSLRRSVSARRIAFRDNAPWVVAGQILDKAAVGHEPALPTVAGILVSMRPDKVADAIYAFADQTYPNKELIVGCHGYPADAIDEVVIDVRGQLSVQVMSFDRTEPLGKALNAAIESTPAGLLAKFNDDDYYGRNYLEDLVQANRYASAPLIARGAMFTYLEARGETVLSRPTYTDRFYDSLPLAVGLAFERGLWERVRFPHRTLDATSGFVEGARVQGIRPYAPNPFEFVYYRGVYGHTWEAVDEVFLEDSVPAWQGYQPEKAEV